MTPKQLDALYKAFAWQNWVPIGTNEALPLDSPLRSFLVRNPDNSAIAYLRYVNNNNYALCFRFLTRLAKLTDKKIPISAEIPPAELFVLATRILTSLSKGIVDHDSI